MALILTHGPYLLFAAVTSIGIYILITQRSLLKSMIGVYLIQTAAILFFLVLAVRSDGTVPIVSLLEPRPMVNPLPHALMLTAIVVSAATLGVGLALLRRIHLEQGTLEDRAFEGEES
jgi:multicomponent Na+:H+ antiporter subunit C